MKNNWRKKVILFLASQGISLFGSSIVQLAIIWHVTLQTSSGIWVSLLTLCSYLPQMLISPFSGVWADRYNRKKMIILADSLIAAATLILVLFLREQVSSGTSLIAIVLVSFIRSLGGGLQTPAVNALLPQLVPEESLMKVNGVNSSVQSAIQFAAPGAAGILLSFGTLQGVLFIDVVTAVIGIGLLCLLAVPSLPQKMEVDGRRSSFSDEMKEGLAYVLEKPEISSFFGCYGLYIFFSIPSGFLVTLFIERMFAENYLYLTVNEIIGFCGMFFGGLFISMWRGFCNRKKTFAFALTGYGIFSAILGVTSHFWQFGVFMFLSCLCIPVAQSAIMTFLQENVEPQKQGRIFSLLNTVFSGVLPLGMIVFGPLADYVPMELLFIVCGAVICLMGIQALLSMRRVNIVQDN